MMHEVAGPVADAGGGDAEQLAEGVAWHARIVTVGAVTDALPPYAVCVKHTLGRRTADRRLGHADRHALALVCVLPAAVVGPASAPGRTGRPLGTRFGIDGRPGQLTRRTRPRRRWRPIVKADRRQAASTTSRPPGRPGRSSTAASRTQLRRQVRPDRSRETRSQAGRRSRRAEDVRDAVAQARASWTTMRRQPPSSGRQGRAASASEDRWFLENRQKPAREGRQGRRTLYCKRSATAGSWKTAAKRRPRRGAIPDGRHLIDLRSDTVTQPTPGMRAAMAAAEVGDDVFGEDPTVNRLRGARRRPARQGGGPVRAVGHDVEPDRRQGPHPARRRAALRGDLPHLQLRGRRPGRAQRRHLPHRRRRLRHPRRRASSRTRSGPINDHLVRTRLVCLENTHNRGGGRVYPAREDRRRSARWARQHGLAMHLDGARLWNADRRHRHPGGGLGAALRHASRSASARGWARRSARRWPGRATSSPGPGASASCSAAACGRRASSRRRSTPWTTTSSGWPRTTATPRSSPRPSPTRRACGSSRRRL